MEKKKGSLLIVFLVIAIILIIVMGALLYMQKTEADRQIAKLENNASELQETIDNLQEKIDNVSNIVSDTKNEDEEENINIKVEIPEASTNISDKEEKIINYFKGIWTTNNGEKLLAIDYGKRFCDINSSNNSKEYGTYTVEDGNESTITLTYTSGKTLTLKLIQGGTSYLVSNDGKVQYVNGDAYYFGTGEGDEGIFDGNNSNNEIIGVWNTYQAINAQTAKKVDNLTEIFGSSYISYGSYLKLNEDGTFVDAIHPVTSGEQSMKGTYTIEKDYYKLGDCYIFLNYSDGRNVNIQRIYNEENIPVLSYYTNSDSYQFDLKK